MLNPFSHDRTQTLPMKDMMFYIRLTSFPSLSGTQRL